MLRPLFTINIFTFTFLLFNSCMLSDLDMNRAKNTREWINMCASTQGDLYCKAAKKIVKEIDGPIVFLIPNQGIQDSTRDLINKYGIENDEAVARVAKANIFKAYELKSGKITSLDGQERQVICKSFRKGCRIDNLLISRQNNTLSAKDYNGMIYLSINKNEYQADFLFPQPK